MVRAQEHNESACLKSVCTVTCALTNDKSVLFTEATNHANCTHINEFLVATASNKSKTELNYLHFHVQKQRLNWVQAPAELHVKNRLHVV